MSEGIFMHLRVIGFLWNRFIVKLASYCRAQKTHPSIKEFESNRQISSSGQLIVRKISRDGTEATRVADSQGRSTTSDLRTDGSIYYRIEGISSQGEADNLLPCKILIEKLNTEGNQWETPTNREGDEDGVDCIASSGSRKLRMQVTRVGKQKVRRELAISGNSENNTTVANLTSELREAVRKKETLSIEQRKQITLVLDSIDFPSYTYTPIIEAFIQKYTHEIQNLGFESVWLVGPTVDMTKRLDA